MEQILGFREALENCEPEDLSYTGPKFTWCNNREGSARICERLDRFLENSGWSALFRQASISHGSATYSDHLPIWLNTEGSTKHMKIKRPFRFEAIWVGEDEYQRIIENSWGMSQPNDPLEDVMLRIQQCSEKFMVWNKTKFGNVQKTLRQPKTKPLRLQ